MIVLGVTWGMGWWIATGLVVLAIGVVLFAGAHSQLPSSVAAGAPNWLLCTFIPQPDSSRVSFASARSLDRTIPEIGYFPWRTCSVADMLKRKPLDFIGSSRDDLRSFPKEVRIVMGAALNWHNWAESTQPQSR
jgi:hypothetical protein